MDKEINWHIFNKNIAEISPKSLELTDDWYLVCIDGTPEGANISYKNAVITALYDPESNAFFDMDIDVTDCVKFWARVPKSPIECNTEQEKRIDKEELYAFLAVKFGSEQIIQTIQELAELQKALTKWYMNKPDYENLAEELSHVRIMTEQTVRMLSLEKETEEWYLRTLQRTAERYGFFGR